MRKVDDGEKKRKKEKKEKKEKRRKKKKKKIMTFIVATNASRPPERRPTGTPHARAKRDSCTEQLFNLEAFFV